MLDHIGIPVSDFQRSKGFYMQMLAPLGYGLVMEVSSEETAAPVKPASAPASRPQFWIGTGKPLKGRVAFRLRRQNPRRRPRLLRRRDESRRQGQRRAGPAPALSREYYGAFVLDPDGHNIEAVYHGPGKFEISSNPDPLRARRWRPPGQAQREPDHPQPCRMPPDVTKNATPGPRLPAGAPQACRKAQHKKTKTGASITLASGLESLKWSGKAPRLPNPVPNRT